MNTINRHTTLTMTSIAVLCLAIALRPSDALGQQKTLKELTVGTWILESVYDQTEDGVKHNPWGPGVKGIAMYDENGHFLGRKWPLTVQNPSPLVLGHLSGR
jgi:Lipocalin-like domain